MSRHRFFFVALLSVAALLAAPRSAQVNSAVERTPVRTANWELAAKWLPDKTFDRTMSLGVEPHWLPERDAFWYRFERSDGVHYWFVDAEAKTKEPLFDRQVLAAELTRLTAEPTDALALDFEELEFAGGTTTFRFDRGEERFEFDRSTQQLVRIEKEGKEAKEAETSPAQNTSPDGVWAVYLRGHDLYLNRIEDADDQQTRLSSDGEEHLAWGGAEAPGEEGGTARRFVNVTWSPDSRFFCAIREDRRGVADLWLVDPLARPRPTLDTYKCSMPGETVAREELWIGDVAARTMVRAELERWPDQMLYDLFHPNLWWSADGETLYTTRRHRDYMEVDLCTVDPRTGETRALIEERLRGQVYIKPLVQLEQSNRLLWWSMRDGWGHLYLFDEAGELQHQVTRGAFNVDRVVDVDEAHGVIYFLANGREKGRNVYYRHLYVVGLDGRAPRLLTPENAEHGCALSPSKSFFVDVFSRVDMPTKSVLRDGAGKLVLELETADLSRLEEAGWRPPVVFVAKSADGVTDQWGVLYKPFDFDPRRAYPIVTRVYPGRQGEFIPRTFFPASASLVLAQLGCIVVEFGNRGGTYERGLAYREHAREEFRDYGLADKKVVIEQLAARHPWIDLDRVGIYGGSSGGFMTVSAMLVYPEFFDVGVAMTAPNDPSIYYNLWAERYYGVELLTAEDGTTRWESKPQDNLELADRLQGRLLMINGGADANVHPAHLYRMAQAFLEAGKRFDMFVIPGVGHDLGGWRVPYGLTWDYFATHLLGDPRPGADLFAR